MPELYSIVPKDYLLSSLVNEVTDITQAKLVGPNIDIVVHINSNIPDTLYGDETRIREVLLDVLDNAVKYTKRGIIAFVVNGKITEDTVLLTLVVVDSGMGIEETGPELDMTKNIVEAMNGSISVKSEHGRGSIFIIKLPQKIRSEEIT